MSGAAAANVALTGLRAHYRGSAGGISRVITRKSGNSYKKIPLPLIRFH
jgi:hypothetical protein